MLIVLVFFFLMFTIEALMDYNLILWKTEKDYKKYSQKWHFINAVIWFFVAIFIVGTNSNLMFPVERIDYPIQTLLLIGCIRLVWFSLVLNILRVKPLFHVGDTSLLRKIFKNKSERFYQTLKATYSIVAIVLISLFVKF